MTMTFLSNHKISLSLSLDPPRLTISQDQHHYEIHDSVLIKCHICSIPNSIQVNWFRDEQLLLDINIIIKTQSLEQSQCILSILEIVVCLFFQLIEIDLFLCFKGYQ